MRLPTLRARAAPALGATLLLLVWGCDSTTPPSGDPISARVALAADASPCTYRAGSHYSAAVAYGAALSVIASVNPSATAPNGQYGTTCEDGHTIWTLGDTGAVIGSRTADARGWLVSARDGVYAVAQTGSGLQLSWVLPDGTTAWSREVPTAREDAPHRLQFRADYAPSQPTGVSALYVATTYKYRGPVFLQKLLPDGSPAWSAQLPAPYNNGDVTVKGTPGGGALLHYQSAHPESLLLRLRPDGTVAWQRPLDHEDAAEGGDLLAATPSASGGAWAILRVPTQGQGYTYNVYEIAEIDDAGRLVRRASLEGAVTMTDRVSWDERFDVLAFDLTVAGDLRLLAYDEYRHQSNQNDVESQIVPAIIRTDGLTVEAGEAVPIEHGFRYTPPWDFPLWSAIDTGDGRFITFSAPFTVLMSNHPGPAGYRIAVFDVSGG